MDVTGDDRVERRMILTDERGTTRVAGIEDEDAERLQRLATARRQRPGEVISSLLRSA